MKHIATQSCQSKLLCILCAICAHIKFPQFSTFSLSNPFFLLLLRTHLESLLSFFLLHFADKVILSCVNLISLILKTFQKQRQLFSALEIFTLFT